MKKFCVLWQCLCLICLALSSICYADSPGRNDSSRLTDTSKPTTPGLFVAQPNMPIGPTTKPQDLLSPNFPGTPNICTGAKPCTGYYMPCPANPVCPDMYGKGSTYQTFDQNSPACPTICVVTRIINDTYPPPAKTVPVIKVKNTVCPTGYIPVVGFDPGPQIISVPNPQPVKPMTFKDYNDLRAGGSTCKLIAGNLYRMPCLKGTGGNYTDINYSTVTFQSQPLPANNTTDILFNDSNTKGIGQFTFNTGSAANNSYDLGQPDPNDVWQRLLDARLCTDSSTHISTDGGHNNMNCYADKSTPSANQTNIFFHCSGSLGALAVAMTYTIPYSLYTCQPLNGYQYNPPYIVMTSYVCAHPTPAARNSSGYINPTGSTVNP